MTADVSLAGSSHDFMQVARFVPTAQRVTCVDADTTVREALEVMQAQGFDQVPVVAGTRVIAVFSYRSLAQHLLHVRRNDDPLDLSVLDASTDLAFVHAGDDVGTILDRLERDGAVGVGDPTRIDALMTPTDVTRYLWHATRPFVLLQDIELAVRALMRVAVHTPEATGEVFARSLPQERLRDPRAPNGLEDLTLGELLAVLLQPENYGTLFRPIFGKSQSITASNLEPVRDVRNKVFHFRDEVTTEELDILVAARQYLRRAVGIDPRLMTGATELGQRRVAVDQLFAGGVLVATRALLQGWSLPHRTCHVLWSTPSPDALWRDLSLASSIQDAQLVTFDATVPSTLEALLAHDAALEEELRR